MRAPVEEGAGALGDLVLDVAEVHGVLLGGGQGTGGVDSENLQQAQVDAGVLLEADRKSTRLNSSHLVISYAVFCLKKKTVCAEFDGFGGGERDCRGADDGTH